MQIIDLLSRQVQVKQKNYYQSNINHTKIVALTNDQNDKYRKNLYIDPNIKR